MKKYLKIFTVWLVLASLLSWSFELLLSGLSKTARAAVSPITEIVSAEMLSTNVTRVKADAILPVLTFTLEQSSGSATLASTTIYVAEAMGSGMQSSDIASVSLRKESGDNLGFQLGEDAVVPGASVSNPAINQPTVLAPTVPETIGASSVTYYVVAAVASAPGNNHAFSIGLPGGYGVDNNGDTVGTPLNSVKAVLIDIQGPTIIKVEKVSAQMVDVVYSEEVQMAGAANMNNYSFNGGLAVMNVYQQSGAYRVVASGNIANGVTTLTASSSILDLAGNPNASTSPVVITENPKIKISEVMVGSASGADKEFVELYNSSPDPVDISGYKLHLRTASGTDVLKNLSFASSTIPGFGFFLIKSIQNDLVQNADATYDAASGGLVDNGGAYISLSDQADANIIDKVGWGSQGQAGCEGGCAAGLAPDQSLERKATGSSNATDMIDGADMNMGNSYDSNNNSFDFIVRTVPAPQGTSDHEQPQFDDNYEGFSGPMIMHMPVNLAPSGSDLSIIAQAGDPQTPVDQIAVKLKYMQGDGTILDNIAGDYSTVLGTHQGNGFFKFTIPQATVDTSVLGIYYYLEMTANSTSSTFMSANPDADQAGEASVARNPFVIGIQNPAAWLKFNITGTVDTGGTPVENALVFLDGTGYIASTSADGSFTLSGVREGNYNLVAVKDGYFEGWYNNLTLKGGNLPIGAVHIDIRSGNYSNFSGDTSRPGVKWTGPNDGASGIPSQDADFKIFIGFTKDMDPAAVNNSNIYLTADGVTPIASAVAYDSNPADNPPGYPTDNKLGIVSVPAGGLAANTTYYLILTSAVRDTSGNSLQGNRPEGGHVISLSTGGNYMNNSDWQNFGSGAMQPPYVMGTVPFDGDNNAVPNAKLMINFSEPMNAGSITGAGNIKLEKITFSNNTESVSLISVSASLDTSNKTAILTPGANLAAGKYRIIVTGALQSATGVYMGDPSQGRNTSSHEFFRSYFEVPATAVVDSSPPAIKGVWPNNWATDIPVNPGALNIQFSEAMDLTSINANTITLKRGTSLVTSNIVYDPMSRSGSLAPLSVLSPNTDYTFTISGGATSTSVTDLAGIPLASSYVVNFSTSVNGDTSAPRIMYANGDDFGLAISFNEPMISAKVTDAINWPKSVLNPLNYSIRQGIHNDNFAAGYGSAASVSLANAQFSYDSYSNTVMIDNVAATMGNDYYIQLSSSTVSTASSTGVADLSGNAIDVKTSFQMPVSNSMDTKGMLGPSTGGGMMGPEMGQMGMMKAGAFPMNPSAGITTTYFVDIPTTVAIADGYQIVLTYPQGFDVSGAKKEPYASVNRDINEWNEGTIVFSSAAESSGGAANDGVSVDTANRTVTISLAVTGSTPGNDFLHLDLEGITNSSIPRGFDTSGYTVDMKILDANGALKETVNAMPFFINEAGSITLSGSVSLAGSDGNTDGVLNLYLGSPMTGPIDTTVTIADGSGAFSISGLSAGNYMIFTDPLISIAGGDWNGMTMPEPLYLSTSTTKNLSFSMQNSGSVTDLTVNLTGDFNGDDIDVFAGSPNGFRVKTIATIDNTNPDPVHLYLPAGDWMVGVGPAMPKGPMAGPAPMPDWMPPMPQMFKSSGSGTSSVAISTNNANLQLVGYVKDGSGAAIADAEVYGYQPVGTGMGAHAKTDTSGKFTLKLAQAGNYQIGSYKPGLPHAQDRSVVVKADTGAVDGNATADIYLDSKLITAGNPFIITMKKPGYTISGKVTNGASSVAYAPVWANLANGFGHADTKTDSSGNYILYVDNGTWNVNAYIPGYGDAESQVVAVSGADATQNLTTYANTAFYSISGTITIAGAAQANMPIRAVQFNSSGNFTGKEFHGNTDSSGVYSISVPGNNKYRVDIWTPNYGEVELDTDGVAGNPANVEVGAANVTNKDITIANQDLVTVTIVLDNKAGYAGKEGFINIDGVTCIGSVCKPGNYHNFMRIPDISGPDQTIRVKANGKYFFFMDIPGFGHYLPDSASKDATTGSVVTTGVDRNITFTLPDASATAVAVSGTVTDGSNPVANAWVWIGNRSTGYQNGSSTDSLGNYSITVPSGSSYKIGAEKNGYMSPEPSSLDASVSTTKDFVLSQSALTVSGRLYKDLNSNSVYDPGEEVPNGWVRAETTDGTKKTHAPADGQGAYALGVVNGTWKIYAIADGYQESLHSANIAVAGADIANTNVKLTVNGNWTNKTKIKSIVPASGGTLDDSNSSGTGVKLTVPPNALGSSANQGNLTAANTGSVISTNSSQPFGGQGTKITATDNSGQAINNLSDYIDMEKVIYKADIDAQLEAEGVTLEKLKTFKNGYWDSTSNDWVNLSTTRAAYYKTDAGDTEWTLYADADATDVYEAFIDTLIAGTVYADYKLVLSSKTNHFTIFAVIMPFMPTVAISSSNSTPSAGQSSGSASGGSYVVSYCSSVSYGEWKTCSNSIQYRNVISATPLNCTLTSTQELARKQTCVSEQTKVEQIAEKITEQVSTVVETIKATAGKISDYLLGKLGLKRNLAKEQEVDRKYMPAVVKDVKVSTALKTTAKNFIAYGLEEIRKFTDSERAGLVGAYKYAFSKLPEGDREWEDVLRIANGEKPIRRNLTAEIKAINDFRYIHKRNPNFKDKEDEKFVHMAAYGLWPQKRSLAKEREALIKYWKLFRKYPSTQKGWNVARAMTYAGVE